MRTLYLVGMAPPVDKKANKPPFPSGSLTDLVALDPRHGVFPNLVMTPLLATLHALDGDAASTVEFWDQARELLKDKTSRRFNLFDKPVGSHLEVSQEAARNIQAYNPSRDVWAVFGFWTISGLVTHLLKGGMRFTRGEIESYSREFVRRAMERWSEKVSFPNVVPSSRSALTGVLSRLFTDMDADGMGTTAMVSHAVEDMASDKAKVGSICRFLRGVIPLPHNEAYQLLPFGKVQNCFVLALDPRAQIENAPPEVFWRIVGQTIKGGLTKLA